LLSSLSADATIAPLCTMFKSRLGLQWACL
jgi:hypothetical protein